MSAISVGGTLMELGLWLFEAQDRGLVNREFSQVVPDGRIYCYEGGVSTLGGSQPSVFPGRLLISLTSDTQMLAERQDGACATAIVFVNPVTYER